MKSIKKIITAAAAAAVIATVGATTAFAISNAANSVDTVQNMVPGNYMDLNYGPGYATTINTTQTSRLANASVEVKDSLGNPIPAAKAYNNGVIGLGGAVTASVDSKYIVKGYRYTCSGEIYGGASHYTPIVDGLSVSFIYQ